MKKIYLPLLLLSINFPSYSQEKLKEYYNTSNIETFVQELKQKQDFEKIIQEYSQVAESDPDYFTAQFQIILNLIAMNKTDEAEKHCKNLIDRYGDDLPSNYFLSYGILLSDKKEYESALANFEKAKKNNSLNILSKYNEAIVYVRMEQRQKALDLLKEIITTAPNYKQAYYLLGFIAMEDGNASVGVMSILTYLTLDPLAKNAQTALKELARNMAEVYAKPSKLKYSTTGDDFTELDIILKNNLAQNRKYPAKVSINDRTSRTIQAVLEYMNEHNIKDGFFENKYGPWMKEVVSKYQLIPYTFVAMTSYEETYQKDFKKNNALIKTFVNTFFTNSIQPLILKATVDGKQYAVSTLENGKNFYFQNRQDNLNGYAIQFNENYDKESEGYFVNNELEGELKRYNSIGNLETIENYKKGQLDGAVSKFYTSGKIAVREIVHGGEYDGKVSLYNIASGLIGSLEYKNGNLINEVKHLFSNGQTEYDYKLIDGKRQGKISMYNEKGTVVSTYNYKDDKYNDLGFSYYPDGKIKTEALYKDNEFEFYKAFYHNGQLSDHYVYNNGKLVSVKSYNLKGELIEEKAYDKDEVLAELKLYLAEQLYLVEKYKNGKLTEREAINPTTFQLEKSKIQAYDKLYYPTGVLYGEGKTINGHQEGLWKFYNTNGTLSNEGEFSKNNLNGKYIKYNKIGEKEETYLFKDGVNQGLYEYFQDNTLVYANYYSDGEANGPIYYYYNGTIFREKRFVQDDESVGRALYFLQDGKTPYKIEKFDKEYLVQITFYDKEKKEVLQLDKYKEKETVVIPQFNFKNILTLENGILNGPAKKVDVSEKITLEEFNLINNKIDGEFKEYYPTGVLSSSKNFLLDRRNGLTQYYNPDGKLRSKMPMLNGKIMGERTFLYPEGNPIFKVNYLLDHQQGDRIYYNTQGVAVAALVYDLDILIGYKKLNAFEQLGEMIPIKPTEEIKIESVYKNGVTAAKINVKNSALNGDLIIYNPNKNKAFSLFLVNDIKEGEENIYYNNGAIYSNIHYKNNSLDGTKTIHSKEGQKLFEINYNFDELNGEFKIFENNSIKQTFIYDSGFLSK